MNYNEYSIKNDKYKNNSDSDSDSDGNSEIEYEYLPRDRISNDSEIEYEYLPHDRINNDRINSDNSKNEKKCEPVIDTKIIYKNCDLPKKVNEYHPKLNYIEQQERNAMANNLINNVSDLVNVVISKQFQKTNNKDRIIIENIKLPDDERFDDIKNEFKTISTDIITDYFLTSQELTSDYLGLFVNFMTKILKDYCDNKIIDFSRTSLKIKKLTYADEIVFIYKGGNTLKNITDNYISSVPTDIKDIINFLKNRIWTFKS
jgi:hypothetical protein